MPLSQSTIAAITVGEAISLAVDILEVTAIIEKLHSIIKRVAKAAVSAVAGCTTTTITIDG